MLKGTWKKRLAILFNIGLLSIAFLPLVAEENNREDSITNEFLESYQDEGNRPNGAIPTPEDLNFSTPEDVANSVLSFPETFDLRDYGLVTSVKNQLNYGTCWTFGSMASMENSYIYRNPHIDLSECHLAWFNYSGSDGFKPEKPDDVYNEGGQVFMVMATAAKNWGTVNEQMVPYSNAGSPLAEQLRGERDYRLTRAEYLDNKRKDIDQIELVKEALMDKQVVILSYNAGAENLNTATSAYYTDEAGVTHLVSCIGWDDTFSKENFREDKRPQQDGAWLIKNSWGLEAGVDGYYYISYEDQSIQDWMAFTMDRTQTPETAYVHDELGMINNIGDIDYAKAANIFVPQTANEAISSVGIYAGDAEVDYTLTIYKTLGDVNDPESGTMIYSKSDHLYLPGYNRVDLPYTIDLGGQEPYSIVIEYTATTTPDNGLLPVEADCGGFYANAKNEPGQSFVFDTDSATWIDFVDYEAPEIKNLCLQGYTVPLDTIRFALGSGPVELGEKEWLTAGGGEVIYYTTDGSDPVFTSPIYNPNTGIDVSDVSTLKAVVLKGSTLGPVFEANYEKAVADVSSIFIKDSTGRKFYYDLEELSNGLGEEIEQSATYVDLMPIGTGDILINGEAVASNTSVRMPITGDTLSVSVAVSESGKVSSAYDLLFEKVAVMTYDYTAETIAGIADGWAIFNTKTTRDASGPQRIEVGDSITPHIGDTLTAYRISNRSMAPVSIPARPEGPVVSVASSVTTSEIILTPITNGEYRLADDLWQYDTRFSGLTPDTTYQVAQRYMAGFDIFASEESIGEIQTKNQPVNPVDPVDNGGSEKTDKAGKLPTTGGMGTVLINMTILFGGSMLLVKGRKK